MEVLGLFLKGGGGDSQSQRFTISKDLFGVM